LKPLQSFDELSPGQRFQFGQFALSQAEIIAYAEKFDPQPFHLDDEAAKGSIFGRLVASGVHTFSATLGHLLRSGLLEQVNLGASGVEVAWPAPLDPDEPVTLRLVVEEVRPSRSKPQMGIAKLRYLVAKERDGTLVLNALATHFLKR